MKKCELCNSVARMYCDSDRAILCWDCDAKVHAANFLVAKHSRTLLCHACQSPTPWTASGPKLGPTVSVCETCVHSGNTTNNNNNDENGDDDDDEIGTDSEEDDGDGVDDSSDGGDQDEEEDDGENQVVPLSLTPLPPPPISSSSSSEESSGGLRGGRKGLPKSTIGFSSKRAGH